MVEAGRHLLHMIASVLDLAKIEAEQDEMRTAVLDVQEVAASCLDLVRPAAEAKNLALSLVVAPGTPRELATDAMRLRQVLVNLLGNAVKFTARGSVELRLCPVSGQSGRYRGGAAARGRRHRAGHTTGPAATAVPGIRAAGRGGHQRDRGRGTGPVAVGATRGPDERAPWSRRQPGRWQRVLAGAAGERGRRGAGGGGDAGSAEAEPAAVTPTPALHVLVVDDVAMNRDIAASFLRASGQRVDCVEGGAEAVSAVAGIDFDVVLMDVRMPGIDGLEATRRIRALDGPRGRVPIVALTAQAFTEQVAECRNAGMDDHLVKPFSPEFIARGRGEGGRRIADGTGNWLSVTAGRWPRGPERGRLWRKDMGDRTKLDPA